MCSSDLCGTMLGPKASRASYSAHSVYAVDVLWAETRSQRSVQSARALRTARLRPKDRLRICHAREEPASSGSAGRYEGSVSRVVSEVVGMAGVSSLGKRDRRAGKKEGGGRSTEMHGRVVVIIERQLLDDERDDFGAEGGQGREGRDEDQVDGLFVES